MPRFEYLFRETTSGLRRNGLVAFAAISTTFIALFLFGLSLLISRRINSASPNRNSAMKAVETAPKATVPLRRMPAAVSRK